MNSKSILCVNQSHEFLHLYHSRMGGRHPEPVEGYRHSRPPMSFPHPRHCEAQWAVAISTLKPSSLHPFRCILISP